MCAALHNDVSIKLSKEAGSQDAYTLHEYKVEWPTKTAQQTDDKEAELLVYISDSMIQWKGKQAKYLSKRFSKEHPHVFKG